MDFAAQLAALDAQYEASDAIGGEHPVYRGPAEIKVARIEEWEGNLTLKIHFRTEKGMAFGDIRLSGHASEDSMSFAKGQLQNLGHKGRLSEVPTILPGLIGAWAEINVDHNAGTGKHEGKTFVNVKVRKLVPAPAGAQVGFAQAAPTFDPAQGFGAPAQAAQQTFQPNPPAPAGVPFDATGAPVQTAPAPVAQPAPAMPFDAPANTPPAAPTGLPFQ